MARNSRSERDRGEYFAQKWIGAAADNFFTKKSYFEGFEDTHAIEHRLANASDHYWLLSLARRCVVSRFGRFIVVHCSRFYITTLSIGKVKQKLLEEEGYRIKI